MDKRLSEVISNVVAAQYKNIRATSIKRLTLHALCDATPWRASIDKCEDAIYTDVYTILYIRARESRELSFFSDTSNTKIRFLNI